LSQICLKHHFGAIIESILRYLSVFLGVNPYFCPPPFLEGLFVISYVALAVNLASKINHPFEVILKKKPMVKNFFPAIAIVLFLSSCSALKTLNFSNNKQAFTAPVENDNQPTKFINEISVTAPAASEKTIVRTEPV
jgi:hypothetical protein